MSTSPHSVESPQDGQQQGDPLPQARGHAHHTSQRTGSVALPLPPDAGCRMPVRTQHDWLRMSTPMSVISSTKQVMDKAIKPTRQCNPCPQTSGHTISTRVASADHTQTHPQPAMLASSGILSAGFVGCQLSHKITGTHGSAGNTPGALLSDPIQGGAPPGLRCQPHSRGNQRT